MKRIFIICLLPVLSLFCLPAARAQVASATTLVGTVTDTQGAAIAGAKVTAVQTATKVTYNGVTTGAGEYSLPYVDVGTYTITVESPGFQKFTRTDISVQVNQTVRTDFALTVGAVTNEITVSSAPPPIETDDASIVQTLETRAISSLPVAGHDTLKLALTTAGVIQSGDVTVGDPPGESFAGPGQRGEQNDVSLDGVTMLNTIHRTVDFPPSPDAIQEVSVQTGTYSAQYGTYLGVHVNAVSKGGTNQLHGALSEAVRNDVFNTHNRFDAANSKKTPLRQNQYGMELDGPVVLPKIYNGRDKSFFMFDYQARRQISSTSSLYTVLTPAERQGDFSAIKTKLSDPVNSSCIVNNVIQSNCINPHSLEYLNFMPQANLPGLTNNLRATIPSGNDFDQYITRIDNVITQKARVFFRYAYQTARPFTGAAFAPDSTYSPSHQNNFVGGYTQVFTPNLINQFSLGRNQVSLNSANGYFVNPSLQSQLSVLTIPGYQNPPGNPGEPNVSMSGYLGLGSGARNSLQTDQVWTGLDTLNWSHGAHNVIAGMDVSRDITTRFAANSPRGSFSFTGVMTGDGGADFMRGLIASDTTPVIQLESAGEQWRNDFFVLDKWNLGRRLSLNLGIRYELPYVAYSPSGIANFLSDDGTTLIPATTTPGYKYTDPNHEQWAPRIGFAYRAGGGWVVRGGAGLYYSPATMNALTILSLNPPFSTNYTYNASHANPVINFSDPNPAAAIGGTPVPDILTLSKHFPSAKMTQWSFDVEKALWKGAGIDFQAIGNHTEHLDTSLQVNAPTPGPGTIQTRRPNQHFGNIRNLYNGAISNYDGFNIVYTQRTIHGLSGQVSYTWSHSLDESAYSTGGGQIVNPYDIRSDYGNSSDDIRHRMTGHYVWRMPFFEGSTNTLLRTAAGGWSLSGIVTIQTGQPVNITISQDQANTGQSSQRPNRVGSIHASCGDVLVNCINRDAFALPAQYTYGNSARNPFYGPGVVNFDTSLAKTFPIYERLAFQFRADAYNTFNHVNWGAPSGNWSSAATFGNITTTSTGMRIFEFMGRLTF
ncbi:MAG TPA: TonB-dependent receptor [Acidobacteriaceae bacterium]|nr:TonB-dependent receptor [Acidobacteriaceae bacterium]